MFGDQTDRMDRVLARKQKIGGKDLHTDRINRKKLDPQLINKLEHMDGVWTKRTTHSASLDKPDATKNWDTHHANKNMLRRKEDQEALENAEDEDESESDEDEESGEEVSEESDDEESDSDEDESEDEPAEPKDPVTPKVSPPPIRK